MIMFIKKTTILLFFFSFFFLIFFHMGVSNDDYEPIIEILEDILGDHRMHNDYKGQMSFDCPVCRLCDER